MEVEMVTLYADHERSVQPGQRAKFTPEKAEALIAGGFAKEVVSGEERHARRSEADKTRRRTTGKTPAKAQAETPEKSADGQGGGPETPPS
ncbi:hypothetical protein [Nonomuraea sp. NPDC050310]|uniref:hypothetical protein n=1 Tax=Nonomuraea sp. NPDC050310 TaxID=3154935 RepID=UPI003403C83C